MDLWNTYYITADEDDYSGANTSGLYTSSGQLIAMVPYAFAQDLFVEGAGFLSDGRLLNVSNSQCGYGDTFNVTASIHGTQCYRVLDTSRTPWGQGYAGHALVPLRTIAVDHNYIPYGSTVYIQQFDGLQIPAIDSRYGTIGGFTHDGYFIADDSGGAIGQNHIDIFAGNRAMYRALEALIPTHSNLTATIGGSMPASLAGSSSDTSPAIPIIVAGIGGLGGYMIWKWWVDNYGHGRRVRRR